MKLEEVVEILPKSKIKAGDGKKEGKYPLYRSSNKIDTYYDEYLLDEEVIIVGTGGNPSIHYNTGKCAYTTQCLAITSKGTLKNKYIYYYLLSQLDRIQNMFRGMTIKQLDKKAFFKLDIPIIEVEIQDKIIENLDKISNNIQSKREQLKKLEQLVKSQFVEMFGDIHLNDKKWNRNKWEDVLIIKNGKNQKKVESFNGKYPIYGSGGIIGFANDYICNENSIIIGRKGSINKPILVKTKFWNVDTAFGLEPIKEKIESDYLYYFCYFYNFEKHNKTVTIPSLTKKDLLNIEISIPPITLQNQFSEIVKQIDKQKFEIEKSLKETQELYESLMQEYYKQINVGIENNTGEIIKKDVTKNIVRRWL